MIPDSKIHGANMGPTWVLLVPGGPHIGPMNLAVRDGNDDGDGDSGGGYSMIMMMHNNCPLLEG